MLQTDNYIDTRETIYTFSFNHLNSGEIVFYTQQGDYVFSCSGAAEAVWYVLLLRPVMRERVADDDGLMQKTQLFCMSIAHYSPTSSLMNMAIAHPVLTID